MGKVDKWVSIIVALIAVMLMLGTVVWHSGTIAQHVEDLSALEQETKNDVRALRVEVHEVAVKVARIEGYLKTENGVTAVME